MNIKSLLLGSAAALAAVTGARAADAPITMVEPEPVEYVRVCDVYGTGFFYIPGTETCLKVGGYVRFRIQANDDTTNFFAQPADTNGDGIADTTFIDGDDDYRAGFQTRGRIEFDAREETELGTLRGKVSYETTLSSVQGGNGAVSDEGVDMKEAYIQLGGLTMGYLDSIWTADDGGLSDGLLTDNDWAAGDFTAQRISYTFAASGFSGTIGIEDDGDGDFTPDVIAKLTYKGGFGGVYLMGVYDEDSSDFFAARNGSLNILGTNFGGTFFFGDDEFDGDDGSDGAFVLKGGIQLEDLLVADSIFKVEGHWASDPSRYATVGNLFGNYFGSSNGTSFSFGNFFGGGNDFTPNGFALPSEYQVGAAYQQKFDKLLVAVSGIYGETFDLNGSFLPAVLPQTFANTIALGDIGSADYWGVAGNVGYDITKNFQVLGEVSYRDVDMPAGIEDFDQTGGFIQFKRFF